MKPRRLLRTVLLAASLAFVLVTWTEVTQGQVALSQEGSVFAMLPESLISLHLHEADLKSILRALGKEYKLNLLVHEEVDGQITLGLDNIALRDALQAIARNRGLTLVAGPGGTIEILPIRTYQTRLKQIVAVTSAAAPAQSSQPPPLITQRIDVQYAFNPRESISAVGRDIGLSGKQVKDLTELADLLKKRLSGQPGSDITLISRLNALVVTDTPEKVEEIVSIVNTIDVPSVTVGIEARIAEVTSQALEDLGVQWGGLGQFGDATFTGGGLGAETGTQPSVPQTGNTGLSGSNFIVNLPATIPLGGPGSSLGFTLGRSATKVLDIQLTALERDGKLKLLAAPRLTTMNHERAWIESGTEIPFQNQSVSGGGVTTFTVEFKSASIELEVTPHVVGDGLSQAVFLDVVVTRKEADFSRAIDGNPPLLSRTIYTRALVKTGETVVIGGLMREDTTETVEKIPWFSDLPFFGWFFRRTQERDDKSQLMIFITPSILPTPLTAAKRAPSAILSHQQKQAAGSKQEKQSPESKGQTAMDQQAGNSSQTTGQQDQEAKRRAQSAQRTTGPQTTGQQTTNQQSAISGQPSAKSETQSDQRTTGLQTTDHGLLSPQHSVLGTPSAAGGMQKKRQEDKGAQTTGQQTANQQSEISGQPSAKSEKQQKDNGPDTTGPLSPVRTDLGTQLPDDRIW